MEEAPTVDEDEVNYFNFTSATSCFFFCVVSGGFSDLPVSGEPRPLLQRTSMFILMLL